jgi:CheY-like chemotaxis protein
MNEDLISVRMLVLSAAGRDLELLRHGAMLASVPIDLVETDHAHAACGLIERGDVDLVLVDAATASTDQAAVMKSARAIPNPPFVIVLASAGRAVTGDADAMAFKPRGPEEAPKLLESWVRVRMPTRMLIVDDSRTTRGIVRKILEAGRFPVMVEESDKGEAALRHVGNGGVDIAFFDYNMPETEGMAAVAALKRAHRKLQVVVMTATKDKAVVRRAIESGAAGCLQQPFYPAYVDKFLCGQFGLTPLKPAAG